MEEEDSREGDKANTSECQQQKALGELVEETQTGGPVDSEESENSKKSLKPISKRLQSQKEEAFVNAEALSCKSANLRSQLGQYAFQLKQWKDEHQYSYSEIGDMMLRINKEEERVKGALEEEARGKTDMEQTVDSLKSTNSRSETLDVLEDFHLCFEGFEEWLQATEESFPNRDLVIHSQELRERCLIGPVNSSPSEVEEPRHHKKCAEGSLDIQVLPDNGLHEEGACSNEKCPSSSTTIQEKINTALHNVSRGYSAKSVQTQCNSESKAVQTDCDESFDPHLIAEDTLDKKRLLGHLLLGRQVLALQEEQESGKKRYARLSLDEKQRVLLHALNEEPIHLKPYRTIIKYEDILHHVPKTSRRTFLEFGLDGRSIGKVVISLMDNGNWPENFYVLCLGREQGLSYRHTSILDVWFTGTDSECLYLGNYEKENGGRAIIPGVDWGKERQRDIYKRTDTKAGLVYGFLDNSGVKVSQFFIYTRDNHSRVHFSCFGKVVKGLDVVRGVIDGYRDDVKKVKVIDCGVVLSV